MTPHPTRDAAPRASDRPTRDEPAGGGLDDPLPDDELGAYYADSGPKYDAQGNVVPEDDLREIDAEDARDGVAPAAGPDPEYPYGPEHPSATELESQADRVSGLFLAAPLYSSLSGLYGGVKVLAYKILAERYLRAVAPEGPVAQMMAEQLLLSHALVGRMAEKGANAPDGAAAGAYLGAAAKLMAEYRATALALKAYAAPPATPKAAQKPAPEPKKARRAKPEPKPATEPKPKPKPAKKPEAATTKRPSAKAKPKPAPEPRTELGSNGNRLGGYFARAHELEPSLS